MNDTPPSSSSTPTQNPKQTQNAPAANQQRAGHPVQRGHEPPRQREAQLLVVDRDVLRPGVLGRHGGEAAGGAFLGVG